MNCSISQIDQDERLDTRVMSLSVDGKLISTPAKTIDGSGEQGEINEISLSVGDADIRNALVSSGTKLNRLQSLCNDRAINIIISEYNDISFDMGGKSVLSSFESRIHSYSDVVVVPRWAGVLHNKNGMMKDDLVRLTSDFLEEANVRNNKMVMGCIPLNIPEGIVDELVEFYFKNNVTSFVLDYCNCLPLPKKHIVRNIYKKVEKGGWNEESILYSVNVRRTHKIRGVYPADDLLTFVHGVDLIGGLHIRGGGRTNPSYPEPKIKKFDSNNYTYKEMFGLNSSERQDLKINNCLSQNMATVEIRKAIEEHGSAFDVLSSKTGAKEYLVDSRQTSLFDLRFSF